MDILKKIIFTTLSFVLVSCACQNHDIPEIKVVKPQDKYLNCANLQKEIIAADFEIQANISRFEVFPSYMKNPTCLVNTRMQLERAQNKAENRVTYLKMLQQYKKCPK